MEEDVPKSKFMINSLKDSFGLLCLEENDINEQTLNTFCPV